MAHILSQITFCDNASEVLKAAQDIALKSHRSMPPFPVGDGIICRTHGPFNSRIVYEIVPSPALLRWLADGIEANLVPMDRGRRAPANEAAEAAAA